MGVLFVRASTCVSRRSIIALAFPVAVVAAVRVLVPSLRPRLGEGEKMPTVKFKFAGVGYPITLTYGGDYKPGDPPPTGYTDWHAWADVQHKAGLRQKQCGRCSRWKYPQELSGLVDVGFASKTKCGPANVRIESPVCIQCAKTKTAS